MRYYSNKAVSALLTGDVTSGALAFALDTVSGLPSTFPFTLVIDPDTISVEVVQVSAIVGTTVTVARGQDGTTASAHSTGAVVQHSHTARDFQDSRTHEAATAGVHGVSGTLVGTSDTQTLSNKNLTAGTNVFPTTLATLTGVQTLTNKTLTAPTITAGTSTNHALTTPTLLTPTITTPTVTGLTLDGTDLSGAWTAYTPAWTASVTDPTLGAGTLTGRYKKVGNKTVHFELTLTWGAGTSKGSGNYSFSLPVAARAVNEAVFLGMSAAPNKQFFGRCVSDTSKFGFYLPLDTTLVDDGDTTWVNGTIVVFSGTYEAA